MTKTKGYPDMQLLRFSTAGSVDDGKSTLIGRLLYDSKSIFQDQLEAVEAASRSRGNEEVNLALLTDGLRAEREQGITIDVAYRYFATPNRKFIIADTPGHVQYTRNMVTGASTSDLGIVLIDARHGVLEQTIRHSFIYKLLGIRQLVVAVNKMDLVDFDQRVFQSITDAYLQMAEALRIDNVTFIPISAKDGDNVVHPSSRMDWYKGLPLLTFLESVRPETNLESDFRFPVQYVIRPISSKYPDFRGYAGRVAAGTVSVGDEVVIFPSEISSRIPHISRSEQDLPSAQAGESITLRIVDDIDISRGDLLVRAGQTPPRREQDFTADVCWFNEVPLQPRKKYIIRQAAAETLGLVRSINYRRNVNTLEKEENVAQIKMNDIAEVSIHTAQPLVFDPYPRNKVCGSLIFIDPDTNETVGAGMIKDEAEH